MHENHHCSITEAELAHRVTSDPEKYAHLVPVHEKLANAPGRRGFLGTAGLAGLAGLVGAGAIASGVAPAMAASTGAAPAPATGGTILGRGLKLALLGTKAGPPLAADRAGISSALIVDGHTYLIDCGRASVTQFHKAGLSFASLRGIFLTHLHADHVADYFNYFAMASTTGRKNGDVIPGQLAVYGPGPAGGLPEPFGGRAVGIASPEEPTPGTKSMTDHLLRAFAYTNNIFMRDAGFRDYNSLMAVHEIMPPASAHASYLNRSPAMRPFTVMEDERVKVTATLVPHGPVFPSYAFRFDTDHGSVTFSGDTTHSKNLIRLAKHSDVLVHEALQIPPGAGLTDEVIDHHKQSHVMVEDVGPVAQASHVDHLVLSHIENTAGTIDPVEWHRLASRGYDGAVTVGQDLQIITVA